MKHCTEEQLLAYADLDERTRQQVDVHMASCEHCRKELADAQAMLRWIQVAAAGRPEPRHAAALTSRIMTAVGTGANRHTTGTWFVGWLDWKPARYALLATSLVLAAWGVGEWQRETQLPSRAQAASATVALKTWHWQQWQAQRKQMRNGSLYACKQNGQCPPAIRQMITER